MTNKNNKSEKQFDKDQQKIKSFDKFFKKSLQVNIIDKTEYENEYEYDINNYKKNRTVCKIVIIKRKEKTF